MTSDKITARVKALLAQAEHPGTPPAEAQATAAKGCRADDAPRHHRSPGARRHRQAREPVGRLDYTVAGTGGHGGARTAALTAITRAYGRRTVTWGNDARSNPRTIGIIGTESTLAALRVLLPSRPVQHPESGRAGGWHISRPGRHTIPSQNGAF